MLCWHALLVCRSQRGEENVSFAQACIEHNARTVARDKNMAIMYMTQLVQHLGLENIVVPIELDFSSTCVLFVSFSCTGIVS